MHGINKRSHVCNDNIMVTDIGMYLCRCTQIYRRKSQYRWLELGKYQVCEGY